MIKISGMQVANFLSFKEASFGFAAAGVVLVAGDNGAGKSGMIDALVWCLFGVTLRGYSGDEVVNRRVGADCSVTVDLEEDGCFWCVRRSRRHKRYKNLLQVVTPDGDVSLPSATETQELVEKILGCSAQTFMSSVVFGQDRAYRFSSLTDKEQKDILDEVLGVERFALAGAEARRQLSEAEARHVAADSGLENLDAAIDETEASLGDLRAKGEKFTERQVERVAEETTRLAKLRDQLARLGNRDAAALRVEAKEAARALKQAEAEVEASLDASSEAKSDMVAVEREVAALEKLAKNHAELEGECPTCLQPVTETAHDHAASSIAKKLKPLRKQLAERRAAAERAEETHDQAKQRMRDARAAQQAADKKLGEAAVTEVTAKNLEVTIREVDGIRERIGEEENPYSALVAKAEKQLAKTAASRGLLAEALAAAVEEMRLAKFWVDAFGQRGLRSLLIDSSLPLLNEEAARVSRALTGGAITVEFSATSELKSGKTVDRFEVKVDNKHGAGDYRGNSAGERAKVDLAVGLALQRLVASRARADFNVMFADEIFDHLDVASHERVVDLLSEIDKESVFVVSHDDDLAAWFPATWTFTKRGGFSEVET